MVNRFNHEFFPEECEVCGEPSVGYSEDGEALCEDCFFEAFLSMCEREADKYD